MSNAEQHRKEAIELLASIVANVPGYDQVAYDYAERIVDHIMAAAVETTRDLLAAEAAGKR